MNMDFPMNQTISTGNMEVKTKYKVGDTLYAYNSLQAKLISFVVTDISVYDDGDKVVIFYRSGDWDAYHEEMCFTSKQEFIDSL